MYYSLKSPLRILGRKRRENGEYFIFILFYCFIVTFTPGPTNLIILSTVQQTNVKCAMRYTYGATLAFALLLMASATLNTALQESIPKMIWLMQVMGSAYMLYLAYHLMKPGVVNDVQQVNGQFRSGFLMQFLNPKVVLFTMTVLPTFVLPHYTTFGKIAWSIVVVTFIGFSAFVTWVVFGTIFKQFLQRHEAIFNKLMAAFLVYCAAMIWL